MSKELALRFIEVIDYLKKEGIIKSKRELANALGISPSLITEVSEGRTNISFSRITKLSEIYNINKDWLLHGTGGMIKQDEFKVEENTEIYRNVIDINKTITLAIESIKLAHRVIEHYNEEHGSQKERNAHSG